MEVVLEKIKKPLHPNALFYDTEGNPMSADTYDKRFLKLKNSYLGMLLGTPGRYQDYLDFSQTKWRSHIGRGVFTNMCLDATFNREVYSYSGDEINDKFLNDTLNIRRSYQDDFYRFLKKMLETFAMEGLPLPFSVDELNDPRSFTRIKEVATDTYS